MSNAWTFVSDVAALRRLNNNQRNEIIYVGADDEYRWNPDSSATDNGTTVIKPTELLARKPGRWIKRNLGSGGSLSGWSVTDGDFLPDSTGQDIGGLDNLVGTLRSENIELFNDSDAQPGVGLSPDGVALGPGGSGALDFTITRGVDAENSYLFGIVGSFELHYGDADPSVDGAASQTGYALYLSTDGRLFMKDPSDNSLTAWREITTPEGTIEAHTGEADPDTAGGQAAVIPALYFHADGSVWNKTGGGDTDWAKIGADGPMALVEEQVVSGGPVQDVTFSGLDGDADGTYILHIHLKNPSGSPANYNLQPNGSDADCFYNAFGASSGTGGAGGATKLALGTSDGGGEELYVTVTFSASKVNGLRRRGLVYGARGLSVREIEFSTLYWEDTTTLLTALNIHGDAAGTIADGSTFTLYKMGAGAGAERVRIVDTDVADIRMRLEADNTVQSKTSFEVVGYKGQYIRVNGELVDCINFSRVCGIASNLIDAAGADAGSAPVDDTTYWAYISNSQASFSPSGVRLSETPPSLLRGERYLGTSGNAQHWRFIGWVRPHGGNFVRDQKRCFLVNYFNPLDFSLIHIPGYSPGGEATYAAPAGSTSNPFNGGVDCRVEWLNNPDVTVSYCFELNALVAAGKQLFFGVAENSGDDVGVHDFQQEAGHAMSDGKRLQNNGAASLRMSASVSEAPQLYEGYSWVTMMGCDAGGGGVDIIASNDLFGSDDIAAAATFIRCTIKA